MLNDLCRLEPLASTGSRDDQQTTCACQSKSSSTEWRYCGSPHLGLPCCAHTLVRDQVDILPPDIEAVNSASEPARGCDRNKARFRPYSHRYAREAGSGGVSRHAAGSDPGYTAREKGAVGQMHWPLP